MPTRKKKDDKQGSGDDYSKREPHKEQKDAVKIHEAYLEYRLAGGEPASPEAYRRALEQFEKLPGATRSTPINIPDQKPVNKAEPDPER
jgi:hypothetical protein